MPLKTAHRPDKILGYELKDRLGAGGYGEVWRAEAPGGIAKAIKLIYGYHDEDRATRELRSLNRVKELRHPFLLSLDRIDIVDDQLVIVTEMADGCLKDRFDECREQGLPGIPRDELLRYLRDAADALDFIGVQHSLQHLDIKPENLLLVSGHVKVADFGLVKEITDASQSLMGGLTPAYSPPELFDGRPCHASDQYSLAIVYQEMLTGVRPFPGTTPAQLASQHMNVKPQLGALCRGDQAVIAKALSKDPMHRYTCCVEFMNELTERRVNRATPGSFKEPGRRGAAVASRKRSAAENSTGELPTSVRPTKRSQVVITNLPPVKVDLKKTVQRPTLFIGVGHTGTMVMAKLRRELRKRWGGDQTMPAVRMLCIDTDEKNLMKTTLGPASEVLQPEETLAIPLRRCEEYRNSDKDFGWISRRWLYNIPRSLQTEGVRPLGRLAFADHHLAILDKLHKAVEDITGEGNVAKTARTTGLPQHEESPRVFIVTSIAGGVGSGCVLDVAYAVKTVLLEHGLDDHQICGILVHASGAASSQRDLTSANTYACLSELRHYACEEGYPGDESCSLPAYEKDQPPFSHTYFLNLGDHVLDDEFEDATQSIAHYLLLNTLSAGSTFFDECRRTDNSVEEMTVRAFGTCGGLPPGIAPIRADVPHDVRTLQACERLLQFWRGEANECFCKTAPSKLAEDLSNKHQLDLDESIRRGKQLTLNTLGEDLPNRLDAAVETALSQCPKLSSTQGRQVFASEIMTAIGQVLGLQKAEAGCFPVSSDAVRDVAVDWFAPLQSAIEAMADQPTVRIHAALDVSEACRSKLHTLAEQLKASIQQVDQDLAETHAKIIGKPTESGRRKVAAACLDLGKHMAQLQFLQLQLTAAQTLIHEMESLSQDAVRKQKNADRQLKRFAQACLVFCQTQLAVDDCLPRGTDTPETTQQEFQIAKQLDQLAQQQIAKHNGGLEELISCEEACEPFSQTLVALARQLVTQSVRQSSLDPSAEKWSPQQPETMQWLKTQREQAQFASTRYGGGLRLLLASPEACPTDDYAQVLKSEFDETATRVPSTGGELTLCYEMADIRLTDIALALLENRPQCQEFVSRLHSRNDVQWSPLTGVL